MRNMNKVFVDTNVLIDILIRRDPFYIYSANVLNLGVLGEVSLYATALSFVNCLYVCRKDIGYDSALEKVRKLRRIINISPLSETEFDKAINSDTRDVEDAIQYYSALSSGCEVIITRNKKHFPKGAIEILTPQEFLNGTLET